MATSAASSAATIASTDTESTPKPKRVILRLRVNEFDEDGHSWEEHVDAIKAYLIWAGRSASEYKDPFETSKHFAHVEPFQPYDLPQPTTFHVILDMEQHSLENPNFNNVPHEIYRVRRNQEGNLEVRPFQNPLEAENVICKTRRYTDRVYPWAISLPDKRRLEDAANSVNRSTETH